MLPLVVGLLVLGAAVGTIGTILGAGGGFLLVPILAIVDPDLPASRVTAISFGMIVFNAASGSIAYLRQRRVDLASAIPFAIATLPGSVLGALVTRYVARGTFDVLFGVLLIAVAAFLAFRRPPQATQVPREGWGVARRDWVDASGARRQYDVNMPLGLAFAVGIGFLASLFGIGGGTIMVPLMVAFLGFPPHVATATSTVVLLVTALAGTATHAAAGDLDGLYGITALLGIGAIVGGQLGARLGRRMGSTLLVRTMAVALAFVGLRLASRAFFG